MVSWVRFPFLSGLPAIFHVFFAFLTSFPQLGHFAISITSFTPLRMIIHKTLSINNKICAFCLLLLSPQTHKFHTALGMYAKLRNTPLQRVTLSPTCLSTRWLRQVLPLKSPKPLLGLDSTWYSPVLAFVVFLINNFASVDQSLL